MKNDPWVGALVGVLALCALLFVVLDILLISYSREIRGVQPQIAAINARRALATALVGDVAEYGKQHPDILQFTGLNAPAAPAVIKPAPVAPAKSK